MDLITIRSDKLPDPVGPYSQAVQVGGLVFLSGLISLDVHTGQPQFFEGQAEHQMKKILENLDGFLKSQSWALNHVVKVTLFITNMDDFSKINAAYAQFFSHHKPARSCVEVSRLPLGAAVELEAVVAV